MRPSITRVIPSIIAIQILSASAFACPNISGTYSGEEDPGEAFQVTYEQQGCDQLKISVAGLEKHPIASMKIVQMDGVSRQYDCKQNCTIAYSYTEFAAVAETSYRKPVTMNLPSGFPVQVSRTRVKQEPDGRGNLLSNTTYFNANGGELATSTTTLIRQPK